MRRFVSVVAIVVLLCGVGACGPTRSAEPAAPSPSTSAGETEKPRKVAKPHVSERNLSRLRLRNRSRPNRIMMR